GGDRVRSNRLRFRTAAQPRRFPQPGRERRERADLARGTSRASTSGNVALGYSASARRVMLHCHHTCSVVTGIVDGEHPMELRQVRYFLTVASTLNFTRAAEMCNVTQPALTKGVQKLEQELGGQLIYRERQLTHLTDLGKAVLPMLERALASTEAVRRRAREFQQKERARLAIGLAPSISASLVLEPIAEICKFVPGLHVELREEQPSRLVKLLLEGDINVALVGDLDDKPERIDDWALFAERYVAVLAPSHRLAGRPAGGLGARRGGTNLDQSHCHPAH